MPTPTDIQPELLWDGSSSDSIAPRRVVRLAMNAGSPRLDRVFTEREADDQGDTITRRPRMVKIPLAIRRMESDSERFTLLQKWEGVVLDLDETAFTARLLDSHGSLPQQQAIFSRSELSPEEEAQLAVGAPFVWTIGYRHRGATRSRDSTLYFRRLPPWSSDEVNAAHRGAKGLSSANGWE